MPEPSSINNPLFSIYGKIIEDFFVSEKDIRSVISIFPFREDQLEAGVSDKESDPGHLVSHINRTEFKRTGHSIEQLKRVIKQEKVDRVRGVSEQSTGSTQINFHFQEFRKALQSGKEALLEYNPFYELTKLVFRHNLGGAENLFDHLHSDLIATAPRKVRSTRTLREIWLGPQRKMGSLQRLGETLNKWLASGKLPLGLLLFVGSTITTARGVNDLLQITAVSELFSGAFDGREAEPARYMLALICGLTLSSAILDFKGRMFVAMAESGGFFKGIRDAYLRNPRWMFLASFLTLVSIKTNYDGIVSIISKKADLAQQSESIQNKVKRAIGDPIHPDMENPVSLNDLRAILWSGTNGTIKNFEQVPKDELRGVASSSDARKGPRYWGKYFIVHGGYVPGTNDVVSSYKYSALSREIDGMLQASGLDLSTSIKEKIQTLRGKYGHHLVDTFSKVMGRLLKLDIMMKVQGYTLEEIQRVFALEHYQINDLVQSMVEAMEENKNLYGDISRELNELTGAYVGLLQRVDKSGSALYSSYNVQANLEIPEISAIDELKKGMIPVAKHKNFNELKIFLLNLYGVAFGGMLLTAIFIFAICMDLADPLIYGWMVAKQGIRDRFVFPEWLKRMKEWEKDFISRSKSFFDREDVQQVFHGIVPPNEMGIRNAFFKLLEEIDSSVKDPADKSTVQLFWHWFRGLFVTTRIQDMNGYNYRAQAIALFLVERDVYFSRFIQGVYPGLQPDKGLGQGTFLELFKGIESGQSNNREMFLLELESAASEEYGIDGDDGDALDEHRKLAKSFTKAQRKVKNIDQVMDEESSGLGKMRTWFQKGSDEDDLPVEDPELGLLPGEADVSGSDYFGHNRGGDWLGDLGPGARSVIFQLFIRSFKAQVLPFSHTRRNWLKEMSSQNNQVEEGIGTLYDFVPTLKETLFTTLPKIQEESLEPLRKIWDEYPQECARAGLAPIDKFQEEFGQIEKNVLEMWGVSQFLGHEVDEKVLYSVTGKAEIDEMTRLITSKDGEKSVFANQIATLSGQLQESLQEALKIEGQVAGDLKSAGDEIRSLCSGIAREARQAVLKINIRDWELKKNRASSPDRLEALQESQHFLDEIPRKTDSLLSRLDEIENNTTASKGELRDQLEDLKALALDLLGRVKGTMELIDQPHATYQPHGGQYASPSLASSNRVSLHSETALKGEVPPPEKNPDPSKSESDAEKARRKWDRNDFQIPVTYESPSGLTCQGISREISVNSLRLVSASPVNGLESGEEGTLWLFWDESQAEYACQLIRVVESDIILRLVPENAEFVIPRNPRPGVMTQPSLQGAPSISKSPLDTPPSQSSPSAKRTVVPVIKETTEESVKRLLKEVKTLCGETNQTLLAINMRAWEMQKKGPGAQDLIRSYNDQKPALDRAPMEAEAILAHMEEIVRSDFPYNEQNQELLQGLKRESLALQNRIKGILASLADPPPPPAATQLSAPQGMAHPASSFTPSPALQGMAPPGGDFMPSPAPQGMAPPVPTAEAPQEAPPQQQIVRRRRKIPPTPGMAAPRAAAPGMMTTPRAAAPGMAATPRGASPGMAASPRRAAAPAPAAGAGSGKASPNSLSVTAHFIAKDGRSVTGTTQAITSASVSLVLSTPVGSLLSGEAGTLVMLSDRAKYEFPGQISRVSGGELVVKLLSNQPKCHAL
ncbi:MAG: hypothetical protein HQL52_18135 [Magnetococcales bacterium]|nr:hypothetical protein [Magnetococcales bacterium]